ncbi:PREDICTED: bZIP transcription factor 27-like [Camelina sativa]|uniref:BZIP transcription factor 27-like n=1 Tax=Camelina sativa TaxID=90675 RepID=A0ABM0W9C0_CAMSA|nr:PREDICTED: bZIP transcription factor 27-like [Camelina sativa]
MEEVWKEFNLGSLHYHRQVNIGHEPMLKNQNPNNSIFQDFLNMPLNNQQPPQPPSSCSIVTALYGSPLPLPPPATVLSLNSGVGFKFLDNTDSLLASNPNSFEESASFGCFAKKRGQVFDESRGDRRHKRMIKNRESAARSRARKQAYTNELELEIAHLQTENARLERQNEQLKMAEATQHQVKKTLQRSSTAPF